MADIYINASGQGDLEKIQVALDTAKSGDVVRLTGTFNFADGDVLYLRNANVAHLTLRGPNPKSGEPPAIIKNAVLKWGLTRLDPTKEDVTCIPVSATVREITFEGFRGTGIHVAGTVGENRIERCRFLNYYYYEPPEGKEGQKGAWPIRVEPPSLKVGVPGSQVKVKYPSMVTGTLDITNCFFGAPVYDPAPGLDPIYKAVPPEGMNNLLHLNNAHLDLLRITENVIEDMSWVGIAVWGIIGRTEIVGNQITLQPRRPYRVGGGIQTAGITFGARPPSYPMNWDGSALIERNTVTIDRVDAAGIQVMLFPDGQYTEGGPPGIPRDEVTVRDNVVSMVHANNGGAALGCLGACSGSRWTGNVITGHSRYGILVSQDPQETTANPLFTKSTGGPTDNTFEGNALAGGVADDPTTGKARVDPNTGNPMPFKEFTASQAQILVDGAATTIRIWRNAAGPVSGSNAGSPPFEDPCAGIASFGKDVEMTWNRFSSSGIRGWRVGNEKSWPGSGDPQVGCIYLSQETQGNEVTWWPTNFPAKSVPLPDRQILNLAGAANTLIESEESKVLHELPRPEFIAAHWEIPEELIPQPEPWLGLIGTKR